MAMTNGMLVANAKAPFNSFYELGTPAVTYGPRSESYPQKLSISMESLYKAACVYARTVVDLCNQDKPRTSR